MPMLFRQYVVMGYFREGGNGELYTYSLEEAVEVAHRWQKRAWRGNPPYYAEVCISDIGNVPELEAEAERLKVDCFHGIPIYTTWQHISAPRDHSQEPP